MDPSGLEAKARAARRSGVRPSVVPREQKAALPSLGLRVDEVDSVEGAFRTVRVLRPAAKLALATVVAATAMIAVLAGARYQDHLDHERRHLAAERAIGRAEELVDIAPRTALELAAAAAALDPEATEPRRAILAASLPTGLRYLPNLPAEATAVAWTPRGMRAATAGSLLALAPGANRWVAEYSLPVHEIAAFSSDGQSLVLGGRRGALVVDLVTRRRSTMTAEPVRSIAAGRGVAALTGVRARAAGSRAAQHHCEAPGHRDCPLGRRSARRTRRTPVASSNAVVTA